MRTRDGGLFSYAPLTVTFLLLNAGLYILCAMRSQNFTTIKYEVLNDLYASTKEGMWEGEWLRLIAPSFLHVGLMHILFNASGLYYLGPSAEVHFGSSNYGTIYILSGVCCACFSQLFGGYLSAGASGSIFGIIGAELAVCVMKCPVFKNAWRNAAVRQQVINALIYFGVGLAGMFGNVDNWGHLGGFLSGVLLGGLFELWRKRGHVSAVGVTGVLLLLVSLICAARWTVFSPYYHIHQAVLATEGESSLPPAAAEQEFAEARKWAKFWHTEPRVESIILGYEAKVWTLSDVREYGYAYIGRH